MERGRPRGAARRAEPGRGAGAAHGQLGRPAAGGSASGWHDDDGPGHHRLPAGPRLRARRDGAAVGGLAAYLEAAGFGASALHVLEALGGPRERIRHTTAATMAFDDIAHPVAVGIVFDGAGAVLTAAPAAPR